MKKSQKLTAVISFVIVISFALFSCNVGIDKMSSQFSEVEYEMSKLTDVAELDKIATRGDDNIVDWQLSREFAELWLENGVANGEYPADSVLWEIPIAIYSSEGNIKFYEFRILSNNRIIGAIVGAATKDYGCPIVYEGLKDGYADEILKLYNNDKLSFNQLPRIIDDTYPNVVVGVINQTRGIAGGFSEYIDLESGEDISKDSIRELLDYYFAKSSDSKLLCDINDDKMLAAIEDYKNNGEAFWAMAVSNKGHIADFAVRGSSKEERTKLSEEKLSKMRNYINNVMSEYNDFYKTRKYTELYRENLLNYGPCGPVAVGFVLDYLDANFHDLIDNEWCDLEFADRKTKLYEVMKCQPFANGNMTWPWDLGKGVDWFTNKFTLETSAYAYPRYAINDDLPGISLRLIKFQADLGGGAHYRPVIAYNRNGWGPFSWPEFKILDLYDCTDKLNGNWETYIPLYHFWCWNVKRK